MTSKGVTKRFNHVTELLQNLTVTRVEVSKTSNRVTGTRSRISTNTVGLSKKVNHCQQSPVETKKRNYRTRPLVEISKTPNYGTPVRKSETPKY